MKSKILLLLTVALGTFFTATGPASAQGTAFTYQGRLNDGTNPANGSYNLRFALFDALTIGTQVGPPLTNSPINVSNGLFTVTLDFGNQFPGANRWLEIGVRTNGSGSFFTLSPRQALTPAPYAITAGNVTGIVPNGGLSGTYSGAVSLGNANNSFTGSFNGNGSNVSNVNAAALGGLGANQFWKTGGNSNTAAGVNFLGTLDNQPLELWVNQTRTLRLEPGTNIYSVIGAPNVIAGAPNNLVDAGIFGATIAGGGALNMTGFMPGPSPNHISASFGTIGGGRLNTVSADHAFIGGGIANTVQPFAYDSVIGGGVGNRTQTNASESVISGGYSNSVSSAYSAIAGGAYNVLENFTSYSFLGGGAQNIIRSNSLGAFIGGGLNNTLQSSSNDPGSSWGASIVGGENNTISPDGFSAPRDAVIAGGTYNSIVGTWAGAVGGGIGNSMRSGGFNTIAGGYYNSIQTNVYESAIGGGYQNQIQASGYYSVIAGGYQNVVLGQNAAIGGGRQNTNNGHYSTIGGGYNNSIQSGADKSAIGSGEVNSIQQNAGWSFLGGGLFNSIQTSAGTCFLGGGLNNSIQAASYASVLGGGNANSIETNAYCSVLDGGYGNTIKANTTYPVLGGGAFNSVSGFAATVPGGYLNSASGAYSFAAGQTARAIHDGAFVWADASNVGTQFASTTSNQFSVLATGGVRFVTGGAGMTLDGQAVATANALINVALRTGGNAFTGQQTVTGGSVGIGTVSPQRTLQVGDSAVASSEGMIHLGSRSFSGASLRDWELGVPQTGDVASGEGYSFVIRDTTAGGGSGTRLMIKWGTGNVGIGTSSPGHLLTVGNSGSPAFCDGTTWQNGSDRNAKEDFVAVSPRAVLEKVSALPITEWRYKVDAKGDKHLGPMAQDFHAAFGLNGTDDTHIATVDEEGVALAAIQGLNQKLNEKDVEIHNLEKKLDELQAVVKQLAAQK